MNRDRGTGAFEIYLPAVVEPAESPWSARRGRRRSAPRAARLILLVEVEPQVRTYDADQCWRAWDMSRAGSGIRRRGPQSITSKCRGPLDLVLTDPVIAHSRRGGTDLATSDADRAVPRCGRCTRPARRITG